MGIVDMVKRGLPLHGEHDYPQIFSADWKPSFRWSSVEEVCLAVVEFVGLFYGLQGGLHAAAMEEVGLGHSQGPFTKQQIDVR